MNGNRLSRTARSAAIAGTTLSLLVGGATLASPAQAAGGFTQQELQDICSNNLGALNAHLHAEGAAPGLPGDPQKLLDFAEKIIKNHSCTFEETSFPSGKYTVWNYVGDTLKNCSPGATSAITNQIGSTTTKFASWTVGGGAEFSIKALFFDIGFQASRTWGTQFTAENRFTVSVNPGRQVRATLGTQHQNFHGRLRVNFGDRQRGHYIWYLNGVTMVAPTGNTQATQRGMVESACGRALPPASQSDPNRRVFLLGSV